MCELLLRVTDKVNPDFYMNTKCTKRGDVVVVQPDGWVWGERELTLPFWRILKAPGASMSAGETFLAPELDTDPQNPSRTLQRRAFGFNLAHPSLPAALTAYLVDDTRAQPAYTLAQSFKDTQLLAVKVTKPPIVDPGVIG